MRRAVWSVVFAFSVFLVVAQVRTSEVIDLFNDLVGYRSHPLGSAAHKFWTNLGGLDWDVSDALLRVRTVDLNKDGTQELIVYTASACGVARGCEIYLLQKRGPDWIQIGNLAGDEMILHDEWVGGYRTISSWDGAYFWNGEEYWERCPLEYSPTGCLKHALIEQLSGRA